MSSLLCCGDHVLFEVSSGPGPVPGCECDFVDACDDFPGVGERGVVEPEPQGNTNVKFGV